VDDALAPPLTIKHATEVAGGRRDAAIHFYPFVTVVHADGQEIEVHHWDSLLQPGDKLYVPPVAVP